jgi:hypothetical protein
VLIAGREGRDEHAVAAPRLLHREQRVLAALAVLQVRERLLALSAREVAVEVPREQRQEMPARLGQARRATWASLSSVRRLSRAREMSCATAFSFSPTITPISA